MVETNSPNPQVSVSELAGMLQHLEGSLKDWVDDRLYHHFCKDVPIVDASDGTILIHTVDDQRLFLDIRETFITMHLLEHRVWEPHVRRALACLLKPGDCFVDVGANIGAHTVFAAKLIGPTGRLIAAEPQPKVRDILQRNLLANGFTMTAHAVQVAVDEVDGGTVSFDCYDRHPGLASLALSPGIVAQFGGEAQSIVVPRRTVDSLVAEYGIIPAVIKVDVEGFEQRVIRGALGTMTQMVDLAVLVEYGGISAEDTTLSAIEKLGELVEPLGYVPLALHTDGARQLTWSQARAQPGDYAFVRAGSAALNRLRGNVPEHVVVEAVDVVREYQRHLAHSKMAFLEAVAAQEALKREKNSLYQYISELEDELKKSARDAAAKDQYINRITKRRRFGFF